MNSHNKAAGFERRLEVGHLAFHLNLANSIHHSST
jgi:hypothetical protein